MPGCHPVPPLPVHFICHRPYPYASAGYRPIANCGFTFFFWHICRCTVTIIDIMWLCELLTRKRQFLPDAPTKVFGRRHYQNPAGQLPQQYCSIRKPVLAEQNSFAIILVNRCSSFDPHCHQHIPTNPCLHHITVKNNTAPSTKPEKCLKASSSFLRMPCIVLYIQDRF